MKRSIAGVLMGQTNRVPGLIFAAFPRDVEYCTSITSTLTTRCNFPVKSVQLKWTGFAADRGARWCVSSSAGSCFPPCSRSRGAQSMLGGKARVVMQAQSPRFCGRHCSGLSSSVRPQPGRSRFDSRPSTSLRTFGGTPRWHVLRHLQIDRRLK